MAIKAVVFDFGGVFTMSPFSGLHAWHEERGLDPAIGLRAVFGPYDQDTDHPWHQLERGEIALEAAIEQIKAIGAEQGMDLDLREMFGALGGDGGARNDMVELGLQLRRAEARTRAVDRELIEERGALAASQHRLARTRSRYQDVDTSGLIELLEGLANGDLDPREEAVKGVCVREERMLRSVIKLHPETIGVHRDLVALAATARDAGVDLTISCVDDVAGGLPRDARLTSVDQARKLLRSGREGSQARASITRDSAGCVFRLVVTLHEDALADVPPGVEVLDAESSLVSLEERCAGGSIPATASLGAGNRPRSEHG